LALMALIIKDIKQLLRDPKTLVMVLFMPVMVMAMFVAGYGGGGGAVPIAVVDSDGGTVSWQLIEALRKSGDFHIEYFAPTPDAGINLVRKGKVYAAVLIPEEFSECILKGKSTNVEVVLDSSYATVSEVVWEAVVVAVQEFQKTASERYGTFVIDVIRHTVYGPVVSRVDVFTAVVMGILLHLVPMSLIAVSISRERERRTFEQLIMTPISSMDIVLGKLAAYSIVTVLDTVLTLAVAVSIFGVKVKGALIDLMVVSLLLLFCSLSLGLLISVISKNQLQAYQTAIFLFIPSMLFSGFFTPTEMLSPEIRVFSKILPLYHFLKAFRNIQLRGWALAETLENLVVLGIETLIFLALAIKMLRLRVE